MAAAGLKAASSGIWKSVGILQLMVPVSSHSSCCCYYTGSDAGSGRVGCRHQWTHQPQPEEHCLPLPGSSSIGGKAKRTADAGPAVIAASLGGHQPSSIEGIDTKSYLWAKYHEMKKLVYGKEGGEWEMCGSGVFC